jgi:hypothetical protein
MDPESAKDQLFKRRHEWAKFWVEYFKHLTTLSTGSILLVVTFLEKLSSQPHWKWAVVAAILALLLSVLGSVAAFTVVALNVDSWDTDDDPREQFGEKIARLSLYTAWGGFGVGMISLALFAIRNLL